MSNLMKSCASILFASSVGVMVSLPVLAAEGGVSGASIISCDNIPNQDYVTNVCLPLQSKADDLLNNTAKAPAPIIMTERLNIDEYRAKGIDAIINSTTGKTNVIPSSGGDTKPNDQDTSWHL